MSAAVAAVVGRLGVVSADCLRGKDKGFLNGLTGGAVVLHYHFAKLPIAVGSHIQSLVRG